MYFWINVNFENFVLYVRVVNSKIAFRFYITEDIEDFYKIEKVLLEFKRKIGGFVEERVLVKALEEEVNEKKVFNKKFEVKSWKRLKGVEFYKEKVKTLQRKVRKLNKEIESLKK